MANYDMPREVYLCIGRDDWHEKLSDMATEDQERATDYRRGDLYEQILEALFEAQRLIEHCDHMGYIHHNDQYVLEDVKAAIKNAFEKA